MTNDKVVSLALMSIVRSGWYRRRKAQLGYSQVFQNPRINSPINMIISYENGVEANPTRIIRWQCQAFLWKMGPGLKNLIHIIFFLVNWQNVFLIQVACVSLQCAITDVLLLPPSPPPPSSSSLPPTGSPSLPDLLLCGDEGVVQRWGEEERGRGGWVKRWGAEVIIILILAASRNE